MSTQTSTTEGNCKFCGLIFVNQKAKINHGNSSESCQMYSNQIAILPNGEANCKLCDAIFPKEMTAYFHIKREHPLKNQVEKLAEPETTKSEKPEKPKMTEKSVKRKRSQGSTRSKKPKLMNALPESFETTENPEPAKNVDPDFGYMDHDQPSKLLICAFCGEEFFHHFSLFHHQKKCSTFKKYVKWNSRNSKYCLLCNQKMSQFVPHFVQFHPDVLSDKYMKSVGRPVKVQSKRNPEVKKVAKVVLVRLPEQLVQRYLDVQEDTKIEPIGEDNPKLDDQEDETNEIVEPIDTMKDCRFCGTKIDEDKVKQHETDCQKRKSIIQIICAFCGKPHTDTAISIKFHRKRCMEFQKCMDVSNDKCLMCSETSIKDYVGHFQVKHPELIHFNFSSVSNTERTDTTEKLDPSEENMDGTESAADTTEKLDPSVENTDGTESAADTEETSENENWDSFSEGSKVTEKVENSENSNILEETESDDDDIPDLDEPDYLDLDTTKSVKIKPNSEKMENPEDAKNPDTSDTFVPEFETHTDFVAAKKSVKPKLIQTPNIDTEDKNESQIVSSNVNVLYNCPLCTRKFIAEESTKKHLVNYHRFSEAKILKLGLIITTSTTL